MHSTHAIHAHNIASYIVCLQQRPHIIQCVDMLSHIDKWKMSMHTELDIVICKYEVSAPKLLSCHSFQLQNILFKLATWMLLVSTPRGPKNAKKTRISPRFQPCQSIGGMSSFKAPFKASKLSVAVTTGVRLRILFQAQGQSDSQSFDFCVFLCASKKELIELKKKCEDHSFYIKGQTKK